MKTINLNLKLIAYGALFMLLSINSGAQNGLENTNVFVRAYNLEGKMIIKGKIVSLSETSLELNKKGESVKIPLSSIGSIKTKRSAGSNVIVGSAIGASSLAIMGVATADPDAWILGWSASEGAAGGALIGGVAGAAVGGISVLFKKSKTYEINGDKEKWKAFINTVKLK